MNSSIIHDNIHSLIHKKFHLKSYHGDIKYHMTLNMIFSVVCMHTEDNDITWLEKMTILVNIYSIMQLQLVTDNNSINIVWYLLRNYYDLP